MGERLNHPSIYQRIRTFAEDSKTRTVLGVTAAGVALTILANPSPTASESQTDIKPKTDNPVTLAWGPDLNVESVRLVGSFAILGLATAGGVILTSQDHKKKE